MGPMTVGIGSAPGGVEDQPSVGRQNAVGLRLYSPLAAAGLRMLPEVRVSYLTKKILLEARDFVLPPMSDPIPKQLPLHPIKAPSPPEEPPAERSRL
jgi:hypothetical protein